MDALVRSRGKIPEAFLRGCGVPVTLIAYLPSLIAGNEPIPFHSCFMSHGPADKALADRLHGRMVQERPRVWYAPHDMQRERPHDERIDQAIRVYGKLLLVLAKASMASGWVRRKIRRAREQEQAETRRKLFPIRLVPIESIKTWECADHCGEHLKTVGGGPFSAVFPRFSEARSGSRTLKEFGVGRPVATKPLFFSGFTPLPRCSPQWCADPRIVKDYAEGVLKYHIPDFSGWKDKDAIEAAFAHLIWDLKATESTGE